MTRSTLLRLEEIIVSSSAVLSSLSKDRIESMNTFDKVYKAVAKIPKGKVTTYGSIAKYVGISNPRVVGYALHVNKDPDNIPCHRVVNKDGRLAPGYAFGGPGIQKQLLEQEGITVVNGGVSMKDFSFTF